MDTKNFRTPLHQCFPSPSELDSSEIPSGRCLLRSASGQCQTQTQTLSGCEGAHGPVARESVGVLFCDKRRLPTPGSEHDITVHLPTVTITDTMN